MWTGQFRLLITPQNISNPMCQETVYTWKVTARTECSLACGNTQRPRDNNIGRGQSPALKLNSFLA